MSAFLVNDRPTQTIMLRETIRTRCLSILKKHKNVILMPMAFRFRDSALNLRMPISFPACSKP